MPLVCQCCDQQKLIKELEDKLRDLIEPKLIKQTWQNIYADNEGRAYAYEHSTRMAADTAQNDSSRLAILRRDTFRGPDGKLEHRCELEPLVLRTTE